MKRFLLRITALTLHLKHTVLQSISFTTAGSSFQDCHEKAFPSTHFSKPTNTSKCISRGARSYRFGFCSYSYRFRRSAIHPQWLHPRLFKHTKRSHHTWCQVFVFGIQFTNSNFIAGDDAYLNKQRTATARCCERILLASMISENNDFPRVYQALKVILVRRRLTNDLAALNGYLLDQNI